MVMAGAAHDARGGESPSGGYRFPSQPAVFVASSHDSSAST
jgi:hypothetical protein